MSLKVLMFGWEFPPYNSGGLGVACYGLSRALAKADVDLTFVLPRKMPVNVDFMKLEFAESQVANLNLVTIDSPLYPYIDSATYHHQVSTGSRKSHYAPDLVSEVLRYAREIEQISMQADYDVIHAHDWLSFPAGIRAKHLTGKPLVLHVHATEYDRTGGNDGHPQVIEIERQGFEIADRIITVSGFTKDVVVRKYGIDPAKIEVVHNGIDPEPMLTDADKLDGLSYLKQQGYKLVLFLGRFTVQKGADNFIAAASQVLEYCPQTVFLMVGAGDMERQLIELTAKLNISDKFMFTGFLRGHERTRIYQAADIFVMPSVSEPFGLVALESLLHDTPVIISKQSGVSEVLDHALKVDFWDVNQLVNMMVGALRYPSLQKTLAQNGKQEAYRASWQAAATKCINLYQSLALGN